MSMSITLERTLVGILLVIAALIVVHAPLTVWLGTQWPAWAEVLKSWKELLMGAGLVLLIIIAAQRQMVSILLSDRLMQLALVYAGLHFVMIGVFQNGLQQAGAGLLIDLRYILYFVLVYGTIRLFPQYRRLFMWVIAGGAAVVLTFAVLQMLVLPKDVLKYIGYSKQTIAPYLTVDENPAYIRINSTLRGPNPLGAYALIVISLLAATALRWKMNWRGWAIGCLAALAAGMALGASYSRSAVIGVIVALVAIMIVGATPKMRQKLSVGLAALVVIVAATLFVLRDSSFVNNIVLHNNPTTGAEVDSNAGHATSLIDGVLLMVKSPLGAGVGSTGSASLTGSQPLIIENQYLLVAHEVGWAGLLLFGWLFVEVMRRVWRRRQSALALGVFGSGVGLAVVGLLLPVWTDDTVSIVWWGLAGLVVGGRELGLGSRKKVMEKKRHA